MKTITKLLEVTLILDEDGKAAYEFYEPESGDFYRVEAKKPVPGVKDTESRDKLADELESWVSIMADELDAEQADEDDEILAEARIMPEDVGSGHEALYKYEIFYTYDDPWAGTVDERTYFTGSWFELEKYVDGLKSMGCYNIYTADVSPDDY